MFSFYALSSICINYQTGAPEKKLITYATQFLSSLYMMKETHYRTFEKELITRIWCINTLSFVCVTLSQHFFYHKILLTFISVVTHIHCIKKCHNEVENFDTYKIFNRVLTYICLYVSFF